VPTVHEDDAERAVRAALEMQSAMERLGTELREERSPELTLRIGVETGEVLVDQARAAGERDRIVTGDAVNTAARLQQSAAPGAVVVGPATYAATREVVEYEELDPIALKGKALPVAAWRAVSVKARRGGVRAPLGIEAPLIARAEELALIKDTVRRMVVDGRPHLVTLMAAAGIGKSRLAWELEKYLDGLPEAYHWRKGRCLAYGQVSYGALADIVKGDADVRDDDVPETVTDRVLARLHELAAGSGADADRIGSVLLVLLGLRPPGDLARDAISEAGREYFELLARRAPLVAVIEDIHWADEGLLDLIEYVSRWAEGPMLLLCLARHELLERRPGWAGGIPNASTIVLEPLDRVENEQLVAGLLEGTLPAELRERIVAMADGNPLFTEELVRMLMDRGVLRYVDGGWRLARPVHEVDVPGSIHAVLAARLDALPSGEKRAAQDAAVVGRIFWDAVLTELLRQDAGATREVLRRLRVKELVVPRQPSALAGAGEFGFRHVLVRDVAYDSLPKRDRGAKHLAVARWAESELGVRADELVELLASHYESALRYAEEFGGLDPASLRELRQRTYEYARRAGNRARLLWQKQAGARWMRLAWDQARRLDRPPRERAELAREYLEATRGHESMDVAHSVAADAIALLDGLPDDGADDLELAARVRALEASNLVTLERYDEAAAVLLEGIQRLEPGPPTPGRAALLARLGWVFWRGHRMADAPSILERAIREARATGAADAERWAIHELGVTMAFAGKGRQGLQLLRDSMALSMEAGDQQLLQRCYVNIVAVSTSHGAAPADVLPLLEDGLALARRTMDRENEAWVLWQKTLVFEDMGRVDEARELVEESLALATAVGDETQRRSLLAARAWHLAMRGRWDEARSTYRVAYPTDPEEDQARVYHEWFTAWDRWQRDPERAVDQLAEALRTRVTVDRSAAAPRLARMALRVGSAGGMEVALAAMDEVDEPAAIGPLLPLRGAWIRALPKDPSVAAGEVLGIAERLEATGAILEAAHALADAALLHARARLPGADEVARRAQALHDRIGILPMLGPLPEERWIRRQAIAATSEG
jgi:tetratricopeptide (TPR) repeat protein